MITYHILTLTQYWNNQKHTVSQAIFCEPAYPAWVTAEHMDIQMYRACGVLLPEREWTAAPWIM